MVSKFKKWKKDVFQEKQVHTGLFWKRVQTL